MHPFCNLQSRARTHAVLVIGLYELLDNPTTWLTEPRGPYFYRCNTMCWCMFFVLMHDVMSHLHSRRGCKLQHYQNNTICNGGFILRVRQRCDGFAMSLSTSLPHRSDNARKRWPSLANIFDARIIASCHSRIEIILTF